MTKQRLDYLAHNLVEYILSDDNDTDDIREWFMDMFDFDDKDLDYFNIPKTDEEIDN